MPIINPGKTSWIRLFIVIGVTAVSFYIIKEALAKTFIQWEAVNETNNAEIQALLKE